MVSGRGCAKVCLRRHGRPTMALCLPVHVGEGSRLTLLGVSLTVCKACASPRIPRRLSLLLTKKGKWSIGIAISHYHNCAGFQLRCKLGWTDAVYSHCISCSGQFKICLQIMCCVSPKEHSFQDHLSCKVAMTLHTSFKRI